MQTPGSLYVENSKRTYAIASQTTPAKSLPPHFCCKEIVNQLYVSGLFSGCDH